MKPCWLVDAWRKLLLQICYQMLKNNRTSRNLMEANWDPLKLHYQFEKKESLRKTYTNLLNETMWKQAQFLEKHSPQILGSQVQNIERGHCLRKAKQNETHIEVVPNHRNPRKTAEFHPPFSIRSQSSHNQWRENLCLRVLPKNKEMRDERWWEEIAVVKSVKGFIDFHYKYSVFISSYH